MDFTVTVLFETQTGLVVERIAAGQFYPSDNPFKLEDMLWLMAEEYGRPARISVALKFWGDRDGKVTPKRIEAPKTETSG